MNSIPSRVTKCFVEVFPNLAETDVPRASQASLPEWDSVAHVTLLSAVSEEFQLDLDDESFETLTSYLLMLEFVETHLEQA